MQKHQHLKNSLPEVCEELEHVVIRKLIAVLPIDGRKSGVFVQVSRRILEQRPETVKRSFETHFCKDQNKENSGLCTQTNHGSTGCGQQKSHYPQTRQVLMRTITTNSVCTEESSSQKLVLRKQHRHSRGKEGGNTERGHRGTPQMHHPSWRHVAKAWTLLRQTSCPRCWAQQLVFGPRPSSLGHC